MDLILAVVLIVTLSWLILLILFCYFLSRESPVLFIQLRTGRFERKFKIYKFRTLKEANQPLLQRRFLLGNILRFTSLDELPQFLNILKGEMSFVGPRPLPVEYDSLYSKEQRKRFLVLPGITGLAQVSGRNKLTWKIKFSYDIDYVNRISFLMDMKILLRTARLLFSFKPDVSLSEKQFSREE
jgi:undecaprenyl phosphate N,N'-diacetylbacillosamine 1-phosphate transferase